MRHFQNNFQRFLTFIVSYCQHFYLLLEGLLLRHHKSEQLHLSYDFFLTDCNILEGIFQPFQPLCWMEVLLNFPLPTHLPLQTMILLISNTVTRILFLLHMDFGGLLSKKLILTQIPQHTLFILPQIMKGLLVVGFCGVNMELVLILQGMNVRLPFFYLS